MTLAWAFVGTSQPLTAFLVGLAIGWVVGHVVGFFFGRTGRPDEFN